MPPLAKRLTTQQTCLLSAKSGLMHRSKEYLYSITLSAHEHRADSSSILCIEPCGPVVELVGIEGGVVSGVFNLESSGVEAPDRRPRHEEHYHEA